ncbi:hypothetical protein F511_17210 [Dorcoceras hygrometricum]|uniref:Uncharacterized protein n=1 Tax=Dorcoceras hygrometricum TaxID=472368 RepID=A0A2Z7B134_9LAMI|nr:hypothetical protein F511_17210 [Dorcoceras hygrometricum]
MGHISPSTPHLRPPLARAPSAGHPRVRPVPLDPTMARDVSHRARSKSEKEAARTARCLRRAWFMTRPRRLAPTNFTRKLALQRLAVVVILIRSTTEITTPSSVCTRKRDESFTDGIFSSRWSEQVQPLQAAAHGGGGERRAARQPLQAAAHGGGGERRAAREGRRPRGRKRRDNQYNQDLGLIHSTNGNHLESPNEGSSIDYQVTIHLHAQNITMFPTNETWYFTSQMLVSSSGGLILILTAQSTRNEFRIHSDY